MAGHSTAEAPGILPGQPGGKYSSILIGTIDKKANVGPMQQYARTFKLPRLYVELSKYVCKFEMSVQGVLFINIIFTC